MRATTQLSQPRELLRGPARRERVFIGHDDPGTLGRQREVPSSSPLADIVENGRDIVEIDRDIVEIGYMLIVTSSEVSDVFVVVLSHHCSKVDMLFVVLSHDSSKVGMLFMVLNHDSSQINKMLLTSLDHDLASALISRCHSILQRIELRLSCTSEIKEPEKASNPTGQADER
jgi:hypothetical protein